MNDRCGPSHPPDREVPEATVSAGASGTMPTVLRSGLRHDPPPALATLLLANAVLVLTQRPPVDATKMPGEPPITFGVAWYPEQWPKERWARLASIR